MIIALTGPAGSGKTTVALELQRRGFVRVRFAGALKSMLRTLGLTEAQVDGDQKSEPCDLLCGKTPREAMQTLGTEWGREMIGEDLWVRAAMRVVDDLLAGHRNVVIDDCRFANEARAIAERGGYVVQLSRAGAGLGSQHASEAGLPIDLVNLQVSNNSDVDAVVDLLLSKLTAP